MAIFANPIDNGQINTLISNRALTPLKIFEGTFERTSGADKWVENQPGNTFTFTEDKETSSEEYLFSKD